MKKLHTMLLMVAISLSAGMMQASGTGHRTDSSGVWGAFGRSLVPYDAESQAVATATMHESNKKLSAQKDAYLKELHKAARMVSEAPKMKQRFEAAADHSEELARLARERAAILNRASEETTSTLGAHGIKIKWGKK